MSDQLPEGIEQRDPEWARSIAKATVEEMLTKYGFDTGNPLEMQEDFSWIRRTRKMGEKLGTRILQIAVSLITVGVFAAIWAYVKK